MKENSPEYLLELESWLSKTLNEYPNCDLSYLYSVYEKSYNYLEHESKLQGCKDFAFTFLGKKRAFKTRINAGHYLSMIYSDRIISSDVDDHRVTLFLDWEREWNEWMNDIDYCDKAYEIINDFMCGGKIKGYSDDIASLTFDYAKTMIHNLMIEELIDECFTIDGEYHPNTIFGREADLKSLSKKWFDLIAELEKDFGLEDIFRKDHPQWYEFYYLVANLKSIYNKTNKGPGGREKLTKKAGIEDPEFATDINNYLLKFLAGKKNGGAYQFSTYKLAGHLLKMKKYQAKDEMGNRWIKEENQDDFNSKTIRPFISKNWLPLTDENSLLRVIEYDSKFYVINDKLVNH
ncbi:hypothetical protein [Gracilimonas sp.]|uniref:hypothetical protein n=1 Tax=Gracilimonas sp. TaxID=1974203 RepID=UPI003BAAAD3B